MTDLSVLPKNQFILSSTGIRDLQNYLAQKEGEEARKIAKLFRENIREVVQHVFRMTEKQKLQFQQMDADQQDQLRKIGEAASKALSSSVQIAADSSLSVKNLVGAATWEATYRVKPSIEPIGGAVNPALARKRKDDDWKGGGENSWRLTIDFPFVDPIVITMEKD